MAANNRHRDTNWYSLLRSCNDKTRTFKLATQKHSNENIAARLQRYASISLAMNWLYPVYGIGLSLRMHS